MNKGSSSRKVLAATSIVLICLGGFGCAGMGTGGKWAVAEPRLLTRWAKDVSPRNAHPEYPRPQMVRKSWQNLNGLWQYAIRPKGTPRPLEFDGWILVPFPIESALSGVAKQVGPDNVLWYRRTFKLPRRWKGKRVMLNFEAVDWDTTVWVNNKKVGTHRGGYDPFGFDITDALQPSGPQEILLAVWDPTDAGGQPRGKQVRNPHKIWYTPTTGIWQTVWLEPVDAAHITSLKIIPDVDGRRVLVKVSGSDAAAKCKVNIRIKPPGQRKWTIRSTGGRLGRRIALSVENPQLWSPDEPVLYDMEVSLADRSGKTVDTVRSYFGMRKIELCKDDKGILRLCLNDEPLFQYGTLDQGFWPDGIYTPPTDEAMKYDIEMLKQLGCNMMRKHVKIEPRRFYYWCDRLGILVWQDMPSGDNRTDAEKQQFQRELRRMVDTHFNHPSIIMWVLFNEGWGQHETERLTGWLKRYNPRRLVDNASGWKDQQVGDVHDVHKYPGPKAPENEPNRAAVLGEFGGLGLPIKGHTWQDEKNWGYRKFTGRAELTDAYLSLLEKLKPLIRDGLSAAVYTQTTDVEAEVNGLMTYDRAVVKMDAEKITAANKSLYSQMR